MFRISFSQAMTLAAMLVSVPVTGKPGDVLTTYTNPAGALSHKFGWSVASLSDKIIASAPGENGGQVYIIDPPTGLLDPLPRPAGVTFGQFGHEVLSKGSRLYVTDPQATVAENAGKGAVFVYASLTDTTPLVIADPAANPQSRFAVSLDADTQGNIIVGAPGPETETDALDGRAYVFDPGAATPRLTLLAPANPDANNNAGSQVAVSETGRIAITSHSARVYLFNLVDGSYNTTFRLDTSVAPKPGFREELIFSGDTLFIADESRTINFPNVWRGTLYKYNAGNGLRIDEQTGPYDFNNLFGFPLHLMNDLIAVGGRAYDGGDPGNPGQFDRLFFYDEAFNQVTSATLAIGPDAIHDFDHIGNNLLIGAPTLNGNTGAVYTVATPRTPSAVSGEDWVIYE